MVLAHVKADGEDDHGGGAGRLAQGEQRPAASDSLSLLSPGGARSASSTAALLFKTSRPLTCTRTKGGGCSKAPALFPAVAHSCHSCFSLASHGSHLLVSPAPAARLAACMLLRRHVDRQVQQERLGERQAGARRARAGVAGRRPRRRHPHRPCRRSHHPRRGSNPGPAHAGTQTPPAILAGARALDPTTQGLQPWTCPRRGSNPGSVLALALPSPLPSICCRPRPHPHPTLPHPLPYLTLPYLTFLAAPACMWYVLVMCLCV